MLIFRTALNAAEVLALFDEQFDPPVVTDTELPCAPLDLRAVVSFTNVTLSWLPSMDDSGIAGYNIYINGVLNQTTDSTTVTLTGLLPLTTYEFGVSAVDSAGNESLITTVTATTGMDETPDTEAPSTPTNLQVTTGANSAVFSWDPSTDNVAVAGYVVFVDGNLVDTVDAGQTSIFISGLDPETLYAFEVYAFDFSGNNSRLHLLRVKQQNLSIPANPVL